MAVDVYTLGIDYGARHLGIALVRWDGGENHVLFSGVVNITHAALRELVEPRASARRVRRSRKVRQTRLRWLSLRLLEVGLPRPHIARLLIFCRRRGQKWLYGDELTATALKATDETIYRLSREDFFVALKGMIAAVVPMGQQTAVLKVCQDVMNEAGDRFREVRPIRIENRGRSRCGWEGCGRVPPRRSNALQAPLLQAIITTLQRTLRADPHGKGEQLARDVARRLAGLTVEHTRTEPGSEARKACLRKIKGHMEALRPFYSTEDHTDPEKAWKAIAKSILDQVKVTSLPEGRNRFCAEHAEGYVQRVLRGEAVPFRQTLTEADLVSRREQILFTKLWRYLEARVLPLAPKGIDRLVIERTAFDVLAGSFQQKLRLSEEAREALYQQGPRYGFEGTRAMLHEEFAGRCGVLWRGGR
jgi:hypothetical protein